MTNTPTPPVSPDPWDQWRRLIYPHITPEVFVRFLNDPTAEGWDDTRAEIDALTVILDAARAADALRHQQEIADISAKAEQQKKNALVAVQEWRNDSDRDLCLIDALQAKLSTAEATIASLTAQVEGLQDKWTGGWTRETALAQVDDFDRLCQTIATLRAERDAAQQERDSIAKQLHAEVMSERERRVAAQEGITLKYVPELEAAQQENQTLEILLGQASQASMLNRRAYFEEHDKLTALREALAQARQYVVARIDRAQDTGHIDRLHDLAAIDAALSSSPRPQEPQPAEPKSSETRKPVVNLMEALKKSLDSLNANRTSQEPGGHQP